MTVIGISVDDVAASRTLARREGIGFALLSDASLEVSRQYVGVDDNELSVPGVVLIRQDGTIAYRRISRDKADRPTVAELLGAIDRELGAPATAPALHGGYAPIERMQLTLGLSAGQARADTGAALRASGALSLLYPLSRHLLAGVGIAGEVREARLDVDGAIGVRQPFYADLATVELVLRGGPSVGEPVGWHAGAQVSLGFAARPSWAFALGVGATLLGLGRGDENGNGDARATEIGLTLEVRRLIRVR